MANKSKRVRILYARYDTAKDALGQPTSKGMVIYDSQKKLIGYLPNQRFNKEKTRKLCVRGFEGKALVKLLPKLKTR